MSMKKARGSWASEDNSDENTIRDFEGKIIGYKRSRYTVKVPFEITKAWVPKNEDVIDILQKIAECEDTKYPNGLGRNMLFLKYIYPIFKTYLDDHGFIPDKQDLDFANKEGKI